jgi:hypothetical protein
VGDARSRFVGTQAHERGDSGTRRRGFGRNALQLVDMRKNSAQIGRHAFEFRLRKFQLSQFGNVPHLFEGQSHARFVRENRSPGNCAPPKTKKTRVGNRSKPARLQTIALID